MGGQGPAGSVGFRFGTFTAVELRLARAGKTLPPVGICTDCGREPRLAARHPQYPRHGRERPAQSPPGHSAPAAIPGARAACRAGDPRDMLDLQARFVPMTR